MSTPSGPGYLHSIDSVGAIPILTWQPWCRDPAHVTGDDFVGKIASGAYDSYITKFAADLKAFLDGANNRMIYMRLGHEMNGAWYPWSKDAAQYVGMWTRTWKIFQQVGLAQNSKQLQWMWCPNNYPYDVIDPFYPGNDMVDWMCFDAYQTKAGYGPMSTIAGPIIAELNKLSGSTKPIAVAEFGCSTQSYGGAAAQPKCIEDFLAYTVDTGVVRIASYFNQDDYKTNGDAKTWGRASLSGGPSEGLFMASPAPLQPAPSSAYTASAPAPTTVKQAPSPSYT
ncbi:hypothetical protein HK101_003898, partial [Irineochytrium annulatum]